MKYELSRWKGNALILVSSVIITACGANVDALKPTDLPQPEVEIITAQPEATLPVAELPSLTATPEAAAQAGIPAPELGFSPGNINLRATDPSVVRLGSGPQLVEMFAFW
ncbi:MAG: hypothetical protein OEY93_08100 [Anaerolineae bacterium]|nr:hypothetical protein [Anaerolineae bacterium]